MGDYLSELRYKPWGETRFSDGTTPTKRHFQGQIDESALGLYFFNARWVDPVLGRFAQADSMVPEPGNPQAWDRYAFVYNNPLRYSDPSGHMICDMDGHCGSVASLAKLWENETEEPPGESPFDDDLGGNNIEQTASKPESEDNLIPYVTLESTNPDPLLLAAIGIPLTGASLVVEGALLYTEVTIIPTIGLVPEISVPLELILGACGAVILDINIAYWVYIYRVMQEPNDKQEVELLPPWGLGE